MLTRFRLRKDFRIIVRCFSDKPQDDNKSPEIIAKEPVKDKKASDNATEKIQELLRSMKTEPKITEAEYRQRFASAPDRKRLRNNDDIITSEKIEEKITKAASDVAQALGGDVKQTEAELLSRVLGKINQTSTSLSDLLVGMKVDRNVEADDVSRQTISRGQRVKRLTEKPQQQTRFSQRKPSPADGKEYRRTSAPQPMSVNIFSGLPLGIFKTVSENNYGTKLDVWETLEKRELTLATAQPPANYFEKMILWTEQGKVWKFPINNEQGLEEEQQVNFSEHIFLDTHLEGWCPKKGPIRHFMELVCIGLSKNAFYTVQEKKDHIMWYKEYFESKKDLLTEVGAWETSQNKEAST